MMRLLLLVLVLFQVSCGGVSAFVIGAAGNIFSDYAGKKIDARDDCTEQTND